MHTYLFIFSAWKQKIYITNLDHFSVMLGGKGRVSHSLSFTMCLVLLTQPLSSKSHLLMSCGRNTLVALNVALYPYSLISQSLSPGLLWIWIQMFSATHTMLNLSLNFLWIGLCTAWNDCVGNVCIPVTSVSFLSSGVRDLSLEFSLPQSEVKPLFSSRDRCIHLGW